MRGLTRRWICRADSPDPGVPLLERILSARGLVDSEAVQRFCEPRLTHLHDPSLLPGVDAAAERLVRAVRAGEMIAIYGDYDVDGITATSILFHVIRAVAPDAKLVTYVPHRLDEGYGLNAEALTHLASQGVALVVTVDCGVTAIEPVRVARAAGLDVIVTDHHSLSAGAGIAEAGIAEAGIAEAGIAEAGIADPAPLPDAIVVHPRAPGSAYPFGDLCGAGVAFKVAWRFATCWCNSERVSEKLQRVLLDLLPLVALGTIADVVPLVDENRILTSFGLRLIRQSPLPGLQALIKASGLDAEHIDSEKVGFVLGPRLNACGRMGHAAEAVRMLTDAPADEAAQIAARLSEVNRERQQTERGIVDEAIRKAEEAGMTRDDKRAIVLADPSWHPGVVGIVCSRLVERFGRPAVLMQRSGDHCRGSARSIDGYSIYDALTACAGHLTSYGGHTAAAGLALETRNLDALTEALIEHANARITVDELTPTLTIDCVAALSELDQRTVQGVQDLAPFGRGNRRPTLRVDDVVLVEPPRPLGARGKHLALRLRSAIRSGVRPDASVIRAVWWGAGDRLQDFAAGMALDVAIVPSLNRWKGRVSVEAEIRDVRVREIAPEPPVVVTAPRTQPHGG